MPARQNRSADELLVARCRAGDEAAWAQLYSRLLECAQRVQAPVNRTLREEITVDVLRSLFLKEARLDAYLRSGLRLDRYPGYLLERERKHYYQELARRRRQKARLAGAKARELEEFILPEVVLEELAKCLTPAEKRYLEWRQLPQAEAAPPCPLWQNGTITDLGSGFANGINAAGQIVGGTDSANQPLAARGAVGSPNSHAVLWQNDTMTDLGAGYANAINASGQIAGTSNGKAVLWQNGLKTILGPGIANAINDLGQVAGGTDPDPFLSNGAFLWQDGTLTDLNKLIPRNSGWTLIDATGINDAGQIVGDGIYNGFYHAFLLTPTQGPVPEPATLLLLFCGGTMGFVGWIWRRMGKR